MRVELYRNGQETGEIRLVDGRVAAVGEAVSLLAVRRARTGFQGKALLDACSNWSNGYLHTSEVLDAPSGA